MQDPSEEQQPTERTQLLSPAPVESEVTREREVKALAVLLLDADGDMFNLDAVANGVLGGLETASSLHAKTLAYLSSNEQLAFTHDLVCYMILNPLGRLATMLKACGRQDSLNKFISGFNSSPHLFFVIQCASTEGKLLDLLHHYSDLPTCDSILFGGLHLASRAAALRALNTSAQRKITLIHTVSHASVYDLLSFLMTRALEALFGELKLEDLQVDEDSVGKQNGDGDGGKEGLRSDTASTTKCKESKPSTKEKKKSKTLQGVIVPSSVKLSEGCEAFATQGFEEMNGRTSKSPSSSRKQSKESPSYVAPSPRLPSPVPRQSARVPSLNFSHPHPCNEFYLSPRGCRHHDCPYSHSYPFADDKWRDYPAFIKSKICRNVKAGGGAESCSFGEGCFYGHRCPYNYNDCPHGDSCHFAQAGLPHADGRI